LDEIREQAAKKEVSYADFLDELPSESLGPPWRSVCPTSGRFEKIARGETKIVEKEIFPVTEHRRRPIQRDVLKLARKAAARVEKKSGL